jgi:hypothetical protein
MPVMPVMPAKAGTHAQTRRPCAAVGPRIREEDGGERQWAVDATLGPLRVGCVGTSAGVPQ